MSTTILAFSLVLITAVCGAPAGVAADDGKWPVDVFVTPVFWLPFQSDYRAYGSHVHIARWTPQGGLQLGIRAGNFAFGVSGLWMSWTERLTNNTPDESFSGDTHVDRYDLDFSGSYTFRDIVPNRLSISTGISLFTAHANSDFLCDNGCAGDLLTRESERTSFWGLGPNLAATLRLADRWYLSASTANVWGERHVSTPIRGANTNSSAFLTRNDLTLRYLVTDMISVFAGYKVQLASSPGSHDLFWHGPTFGLTVRFNVR